MLTTPPKYGNISATKRERKLLSDYQKELKMPQIDYDELDELAKALQDVECSAHLTMEEFQESLKSLQEWFASHGITLSLAFE